MSQKLPIYTIIRQSGRSDWFNDKRYIDVLRSISIEYGSAGSGWDRPNMLLCDGKVVIEKGLADISWDYGRRSSELLKEMHSTIDKEFTPEWEKESE